MECCLLNIDNIVTILVSYAYASHILSFGLLAAIDAIAKYTNTRTHSHEDKLLRKIPSCWLIQKECRSGTFSVSSTSAHENISSKMHMKHAIRRFCMANLRHIDRCMGDEKWVCMAFQRLLHRSEQKTSDEISEWYSNRQTGTFSCLTSPDGCLAMQQFFCLTQKFVN